MLGSQEPFTNPASQTDTAMLPLRFLDKAKFFIERQFVKGAIFQLLIVAAVIGLISLLGGLLAYPVGEGEDWGDAIWWAFLRLTDPGYLGDDQGSWRRLVSTLLTVSGYVVFMGTLVAILTRSLIARMTELERGLTPVSFRNHVVILGWNNRTLPLVRELLGSSGSMRRHLLGRPTGRLKLVILAEEMSSLQAQLLREEPGIGARARHIVLRSGSALQSDALHRAACLSAAAVIIPSGSQQSNSLLSSDVEALKALMSIDAQARQLGRPAPFAVVEMQSANKRAIAQRAYSGPLQVIAGDATIASLMAQNIMHPGLSEVYNELLTDQEGNEFYLRGGPEFEGESLAGIAMRCPKALICGVLEAKESGGQLRLNAPSNSRINTGDKLVMIARQLEDTEPVSASGHRLKAVERLNSTPVKPPLGQTRKRLLFLGWGQRVPALIHELGSYRHYRFSVDLVSVVPEAERHRAIKDYNPEDNSVQCRQIEADFLRSSQLTAQAPWSYDSILLLSSDRLESGEEADARAIVGHALLEQLFQGQSQRPQLLMELSEPDNALLLDPDQIETLVSPLILSHLLAQVALRPELQEVFNDLFTEGGAEIRFRPAGDYGIQAPLPFWKLELMAGERGETALGVYYHQAGDQGRRLHLNPARDSALNLSGQDQLVILTDTGIHKKTAV